MLFKHPLTCLALAASLGSPPVARAGDTPFECLATAEVEPGPRSRDRVHKRQIARILRQDPYGVPVAHLRTAVEDAIHRTRADRDAETEPRHREVMEVNLVDLGTMNAIVQETWTWFRSHPQAGDEAKATQLEALERALARYYPDEAAVALESGADRAAGPVPASIQAGARPGPSLATRMLGAAVGILALQAGSVEALHCPTPGGSYLATCTVTGVHPFHPQDPELGPFCRTEILCRHAKERTPSVRNVIDLPADLVGCLDQLGENCNGTFVPREPGAANLCQAPGQWRMERQLALAAKSRNVTDADCIAPAAPEGFQVKARAYRSVDPSVPGLCRFEISGTGWAAPSARTLGPVPGTGGGRILEEQLDRSGVRLTQSVFLPPHATACLTQAYDNLKAVLRQRLAQAAGPVRGEL
jgi:hypothetical protein